MATNTCSYLKPHATTAKGRERRDDIIGELILSAIERAKLILLSEDPESSKASGGVTMDDIPSGLVGQVYEADVVVVDVTCYETRDDEAADDEVAKRFDLCPFLYYFMALSHTLGNKTILVTDSVAHLPSSLIHHHTIVYSDKGIKGVQKFQRDFAKAAKEILAHDDQADNPIQAYIKEVRTQEMAQKLAQLEGELATLKQQEAEIEAKEAEVREKESELKERADKIQFRLVSPAN